MIEQRTIDGRDVTIAYLTHKFAPATPDTAQYAKLLFDDGEMILLATGIPPVRRHGQLPPHPMIETIGKLGEAMIATQQHRETLKRRFGLTDDQIDTMPQVSAARNHRLTTRLNMVNRRIP